MSNSGAAYPSLCYSEGVIAYFWLENVGSYAFELRGQILSSDTTLTIPPIAPDVKIFSDFEAEYRNETFAIAVVAYNESVTANDDIYVYYSSDFVNPEVAYTKLSGTENIRRRDSVTVAQGPDSTVVMWRELISTPEYHFRIYYSYSIDLNSGNWSAPAILNPDEFEFGPSEEYVDVEYFPGLGFAACITTGPIYPFKNNSIPTSPPTMSDTVMRCGFSSDGISDWAWTLVQFPEEPCYKADGVRRQVCRIGSDSANDVESVSSSKLFDLACSPQRCLLIAAYDLSTSGGGDFYNDLYSVIFDGLTWSTPRPVPLYVNATDNNIVFVRDVAVATDRQSAFPRFPLLSHFVDSWLVSYVLGVPNGANSSILYLVTNQILPAGDITWTMFSFDNAETFTYPQPQFLGQVDSYQASLSLVSDGSQWVVALAHYPPSANYWFLQESAVAYSYLVLEPYRSFLGAVFPQCAFSFPTTSYPHFRRLVGAEFDGNTNLSR